MLRAIVRGEIHIVEEILIKNRVDPNYIHHDYKVCYGSFFVLFFKD